MTKRDTLELVIKAFGVWLMAMFVRTIPMTIIQFTLDTSEFIANRPAYLALNVMHSLLYLVVACVFLFKSRTIVALVVQEDLPSTVSRGPSPAYAQLSFWIVLIGLYYFVSSAGDLLNHVVKLCFEGRHYAPGHVVQFMTRDLIPSAVTFLLSLCFIFKGKVIETFIQRKTSKDTQQTPPGDVLRAAPEE